MTRYYFWMSLSLFLISCGRSPVVQVGQFAPYVSRFEDTSKSEGKAIQVTDLVVKFGPMDNAAERGICQIDDKNPPTILVNEDAWQYMSEPERESLLFHEMGHCVLHRKHNNEYLPAGIPSSVMNAYTLDPETYIANSGMYKKELFNSGN